MPVLRDPALGWLPPWPVGLTSGDFIRCRGSRGGSLGKKPGRKEKLMKPYPGVTKGLRGSMGVASFYLEVFWRRERNLVEILSR